MNTSKLIRECDSSFLAGSLPLTITLSPSQLRLITAFGVGILVGTSMIVIIPEGIEAVVSSGLGGHSHSHETRSFNTIQLAGQCGCGTKKHGRAETVGNDPVSHGAGGPDLVAYVQSLGLSLGNGDRAEERRALESRDPDDHGHDHDHDHGVAAVGPQHDAENTHMELPTFHIGLSMVLGFILMFLIDRIPRHAADRLATGPQMRHVSLEDLRPGSALDGEDDHFLGTPVSPPKRSRSFATTVGLVIHASADGIAMGAGATSSDTQLGLIIFVAIMLHKAPAAFGLSALLLKQGLSRRAARAHLLVFSLAAPLGALSTWAIIALLGGGQFEGAAGKWWTGMILLFSAGTFLYVAMHAMQEEGGSGHDHGFSESSANMSQRPQVRDTLVTVAGMLLPLVTQFGHHH
ncbi:hypothetical protein ACRALDRAFT_1077392 [Sodiomyces alcalophilus JCM 7366]|uniref:uncharacterized protein n=1 Tax=Sodiomyces alcalophilus JCM 7366 TaxID=591952 RepID=UPI0039B55E06